MGDLQIWNLKAWARRMMKSCHEKLSGQPRHSWAADARQAYKGLPEILNVCDSLHAIKDMAL